MSRIWRNACKSGTYFNQRVPRDLEAVPWEGWGFCCPRLGRLPLGTQLEKPQVTCRSSEEWTADSHVCVRARAIVDFPAQDCSWKVRQVFDCFKPLCFGVLCHSSADHRSTPSPALRRAAARGSFRTLFYPTGARSCVPTNATGFRESRRFSVYGTAA